MLLISDLVLTTFNIFRAISIIDDTFNLILLMLLLYFGILFALYGFLGVTVSITI